MSDIELEEKETDDGDNEEKEPTIIKSKKGLKERIKLFFQNPKKRLIFITISGLVLISLVSAGFYLQNHKNDDQSPETDVKKEAVQLYEAPLDGVMTDETSTKRHPLGIIVENHVDARPQSGLDKASIVYEAIAEGGITRFLALYGTYEAEKVGPVRSARTYYVDWAHGYDAYLAHVGGNMDALDKISAEKILDLDQFKYSSPYWRVSGAGLASEHTMYTSTIKLRDQASKNKYSEANNFSIFKFKDDPAEAEKAALPASQTVEVNYSTAQYQALFQYDPKTNSYKRFIAGKPQYDAVSKDQITSKNIVVMTVKKTPTVTKINESGWSMDTIGTGKAKIFFDGKTIEGTWKKTSKTDREIFYDSTGTEIIFNRGQFWICVIPPEGTVSVK